MIAKLEQLGAELCTDLPCIMACWLAGLCRRLNHLG